MRADFTRCGSFAAVRECAAPGRPAPLRLSLDRPGTRASSRTASRPHAGSQHTRGPELDRRARTPNRPPPLSPVTDHEARRRRSADRGRRALAAASPNPRRAPRPGSLPPIGDIRGRLARLSARAAKSAR